MSELQKKAGYRPDIDGLRAIAVVAVIFFHANIPGFAGGFVGVDVFFVISGFLITGIIVRQLQQGTFSLVTFWERRVRRIVPVLTVVLLATAVVGYWLILFPLDYLDFGQSLLAQAIFLSNIFFLRKSDYFAGPAEESPLLHTWSLAIEEQFYVIFPLLLLLLWKFGKKIVLFVLGVFLLSSLVWSEYLVSHGTAAFSVSFLPPIWAAADNATAAFYLLPARAYELLIGGLLALLALRPSHRWLAEISAIAGLGFIVWSVVTFSEETMFPGVAVLLPTIGTALLLFAHTGYRTIVTTIVSRPSVVFIGLLSYSLYLWHWPVLVLGKYWLGMSTLSVVQTLGLLVLTLLLSIGSYYLVENPMRTWRPATPSWQVILAGLSVLGVLAAVGYIIMSHHGFPERAPAAARQIALGATDFGPDRTRCFVESKKCTFGNEDVAVTHVVLGDSHGGALLPAIAAAAEETDVQVATYLSPGCSPLRSLATKNADSTCDRVHQAALETIQNGTVTDVLFVSRWSNWRELQADPDEALALFTQAVEETVTELQSAGVTVTVWLQVPHHRYFKTRTAFYAAVETTSVPSYSLPRTTHELDQRPVTVLFEQLQTAGLLTILNPATVLCDDVECDLVRDDVLLYQDSNHVNQTGARLLTPLLSQFLDSNKNEIQ